jgi:PAS domain S-box-containing protein
LVVQHEFNGIVKYISNNCDRITGYAEEELLNQDPYQFIHPDDIQEIVTKHNNILNLPNEVITFRFLKKNQEYVWFETSVKIIRDSADRVLGIQTSSRDISQRLNDQEEVKRALEKQSELNDLKSGFVTMASHQFRTPLSVIYSNIELLHLKMNQSINKEEIKMITDRITSEVDRMTELMNNILLFGENESNKLKIDLKTIAFEEFIDRLIETYYQQEKDGRKLIVTMQGSKQKIETDERLLLHILTNLISNAFKYSIGCEQPELVITYFDHYYKIEIIDYGIGILPEENKHLFKSFFRGSNTANIKGSGLGLIIAKQFTELLNGSIRIESIPKNTRVILEFPYKQM